MKTRDLTNDEKLLLQRRRAGHSQRDAAIEIGVSHYRYRRWEAGQEKPPKVNLGRLEPHEACFIRRRRAGISLKTLADVLGVSRWWLCQMEYGKGATERLVEHWSSVDRPWRGVALAKG